MQRKNFGVRSGVVVDWCGSHGTWLDAHEVEDIAAFVMEGGADAASGATLPADPARTAAVLAAEQLLIDERERSQARARAFTTPIAYGRTLKGIGDFFEQLLR